MVAVSAEEDGGKDIDVTEANGRAPMAVLMYHSVSHVSEPSLRSLGVPPELLRDQLTALREAGYRLVGLSEAVDLRNAGKADREVGLTFDDGYVDFLRSGLPILAELEATATLYVIVGRTETSPSQSGPQPAAFDRLLTWDEVREVADAGIEVGNHGLRHHPLDMLAPEQVDAEIRASHERLADEIRRPVRSFCYPHGYHDGTVRSSVARAGYDNACEVGRRLFTAADDRLAIPRLQATPDDSPADLLRLVETGGSQLLPTLKRAAQPGWRVVRRFADRAFGMKLT